MRKTAKFVMPLVLAFGVSLSPAAPAMAEGPVDATLDAVDTVLGGGVTAANNWNFTASAVCLQEVAVVPVLGDWVGNNVNNCSNENVIDHSGH
ncbi:hypothetical protein NQK81_35300 [Amycolatopsis roodepoortensis]|uniref:hypothetical protein n=1 Tax=Amycolatopsis roodepoortensis TaxID=700274 RepID=UPI00214AD349|nr:hypothetical protein [Amycolatopsis roodepoortensis]UUV29990.1 hypothetical protein NQK81_35300 [Amycolatopsis roodepoortensis]